MVTEKTDGHKSTIFKLANKLTDWEKVWTVFDGMFGRAGISFLKLGTTMNAETYVAILEELKWIKCQDITRDMCKTLALSMP